MFSGFLMGLEVQKQAVQGQMCQGQNNILLFLLISALKLYFLAAAGPCWKPMHERSL